MTATFTRRASLIATASAAAGSMLAPSSASAQSRRFPRNFLWGTASAAHQVEGNNVNSDLWLMENMPNSVFAEPSGDACDHYRLYADDIRLLAGLGFNTHRLSIEWARIEPEPGRFSSAALAHYRDVLSTCRAHQLTTVATLHHFTSPRWFAAAGGFERAEATQDFARYAEYVVRGLGDQIDYLCTINEANLNFAPLPQALLQAARLAGSDRFSTFIFSNAAVSKPIVRAAHVAARAAVKRAHPNLPVGMTLAMADIQSAEGDLALPDGASAIRESNYGAWLDLAKEDDFVGVQNYTREIYGRSGPVRTPNAPRTQINQEIYPASLEGVVRYAAERCGRPILVTEHGIGVEDDATRIRFVHDALQGLQHCLDDGLDVRGYIHWSSMDNFEWLFGYRPKFGLVAVDRQTQRRTAKPSAHYLGRISRTNRLQALP